MPLSDEQRRLLDVHIRSNTIYDWHIIGTHSDTSRSFIIDSVEKAMDTKRGIVRDLFLPNSFINGCECGCFFFRVAAIASGDEGFGWHAVDFGPPLSRNDRRQRYVYTWTLRGEAIRFYTKTLNDGHQPELVWYVCKGGRREEDIDSGDDTDRDEIQLWTHQGAAY
jgi:hypothetical protein